MNKTHRTESPATGKGTALAPELGKPVHYIMWRFNAGGMELSVNGYIEAFATRRPLYAYSLKSRKNNLFNENRIRVDGAGGKQHFLQYFRYCRRHRGAIFHLLNTGPIILLLTLLAGVRKPVYHIHGTKYWKRGYDILYLKPLWWLSNRLGVTFIANSEHSAGTFRRKVLPVQPRVIYNGFDRQQFVDRRSLRTVPKRLAYAGRLHLGKNVELVIRLFEEVAADYPNMELHLAGDGAARPQLEALARRSPFSERIHFHGFIKDIASFYGSADLFLFLSSYESFGNVLAEALLTGLPVLTSDLPSFREIHGGEPDFVLGDPKDYPQLRKRFCAALAAYPELARKAYETGRCIEDKFSIQQHLSTIAALYEEY